MGQDIRPCGYPEAVFEPDLAAVSSCLSRRRSLSSLGLDFHIYGMKMVVSGWGGDCYLWDGPIRHDTYPVEWTGNTWGRSFPPSAASGDSCLVTNLRPFSWSLILL